MGLFHTGRVHGVPHTFKSTMAEFLAQRDRHPEFPRFLIEASSQETAEAIAAAVWNGTAFYSTGRGQGQKRTYVVTGLVASEPVTLADGAADQSLIPGVAPVALATRQIEAETKRREARRGHAAMPCGGLWDETAINQGSLF
jgi:hypothetical protein